MRRYKSIILIVLICIGSIVSSLPVHASVSRKDVLNQVALNPIQTGYAPLDDLVKEILKQTVSNDMTTYDKVLACYDYLINELSYSSTTWDVASYYDIYYHSGYTSDMDKKIIYDAYRALKFKKAACNGYSSAFIVLTRAIGLPTYLMYGQTSKVGGGYTGHYWVNLKWNGVYYVFDPQVEDNIAKGGTVFYYRFCKKDSEIPGKYLYSDREGNINSFHDFSVLESISLSKTKATLYEGDKLCLNVALNPYKIKLPITYKSLKKSVATVSKTGEITAKKAGKATISVTAGNKTKKCVIEVKKSYIKFKKSKVTLNKAGDKYRLEVTRSKNLSQNPVVYQSSDTSVVSVTNSGEIKAGKRGTAKITAYVGNKKATCTVKVW